MGKMDKTEKYTVAGLCFGGGGVFLCEDALRHVAHIDRY